MNSNESNGNQQLGLEARLRAAVREVPDFPQPGILFKDITPILLDPRLMAEAAQALAAPWAGAGITQVVGIESRGFLFGPMIAQALGCGFVIVRKAGKLPPATTGISYSLEYGNASIEVGTEALCATDRVLIHDDLLATGGTAAAAAALARRLGAQVAGFSFLIELGFLEGRGRLEAEGAKVEAVLGY